MTNVDLTVNISEDSIENLFVEFVDIIFRSMDSRLSRYKLDSITKNKLYALFGGANKKVYIEYRKVFDANILREIEQCVKDITNDVDILKGNKSVSVNVPGRIVREAWAELAKITIDALNTIEVDSDEDNS